MKTIRNNLNVHMKLIKLPPMLMAVLLQFAPICRSVFVSNGPIRSGFSIMFRWTAALGMTLGTVDAVSGASSTIRSLKVRAGSTVIDNSLTPSFPEGADNISMQIIVGNPGSDHLQDYWDCTPLPDNFTIDTALGGDGFITLLPGRSTVAGVYEVVLKAGNSNFGFITTNATITVTSSNPDLPPTITSPPGSKTVTAGENTSLVVVAEDNGSPPLSYEWKKDGVVVGGNSATLAFNPVTVGDAGSYVVVVSNSAGSVTSSPAAILTVMEPVAPPEVTTPPASRTVTVGDNVAFRVEATGANLSYQWRKDGADVGTDSAALEISSVTPDDAGSYDVVVSNTAGSVTSSPAAVLVVEEAVGAPGIDTPPGNQIAYIGGSAEFTVFASSSVPMSYQWRKDGVNVGTDSATLAITPVTTDDAGGYDVVVSNSAGSVTTMPVAELTVLQPEAMQLEMLSVRPFVLGWQAIVGKTYTLQLRDNFSPDVWHDLGQTNAAATGPVSMTDGSAGGANIRFYRIKTE